MENKFFEQVEVVLKEAGFKHISQQSTAHSATLSAEKGAERLVMHLTDREEQPHSTAANPEIPDASDIRVAATLTGVRPDLEGQLAQRTGQGGAIRKLKRR
jgi:hypothetical protein